MISIDVIYTPEGSKILEASGIKDLQLEEKRVLLEGTVVPR